MTTREMTEAAARALGLRLNWEEVHDCHWIDFNQGIASEPWTPRTDSAQCFTLAAALRISVEHNPPSDPYGWVIARIDDGQVLSSYQENVHDESQRADAMRLAILRCAASRSPANG